jgi:Fe-S cluster assembly iron-binding protein IscA
MSLLDSTTHFKKYVDECKRQDMTSICFTEHGTLALWVEKKMYCEERLTAKKCQYAKENSCDECEHCDKFKSCIKRKSVKYLHGIEIYLTEELEPK